MKLRDYLDERAIDLELGGEDRDAALRRLVNCLDLAPDAREAVLRLLRRREELGSTGIGRGIAIPHARIPAVGGLRLAFGRHPHGLPWGAIDDQPVRYFFLIVAPPVERTQEYLPCLGRIAQLAKSPDLPERLQGLQRPGELLGLLEEKGV